MKNFHLKPDEELFEIIDKIKKTRDDDIVLVVPRGLSALRSIINLKLLKEEAISLGKNISIVCADSLIKKLTQQAGIEVSEKPKKDLSPEVRRTKGKDNWPEELLETEEESEPVKKRVMSDIVKPRVEKPAQSPEDIEAGPPEFEDFGGEEEESEEEEEEEPEEDEIIEEPTEEEREEEKSEEEIFEKASRRPKEVFKFFTKKRLIVSGAVIGVVILGFILYFVLPRAQIIISPKKEIIRFETEIIANKNIDSVNFSENSIPGQVFQLEMEDSRKFPTTGEKDVEEKARGTITVYNQYSSSDQTLVKTTRFLSEDGKLFRLVETTVIPGATIEEGQIIPSSKDVEVAADEAGEAYNIGPTTFTIPGFQGSPKYTSFTARSTESMTGGAKGKMRVATKDDIDGAMEIVSLELKDQVQKEFSKKIPDELKLLDSAQTLEIIESDSSLKPDEPGKDFTISVKVRAWGLAFKEEDILYLIENNVADKISENKTLISSSIQVDYTNIELDLAQGKADFSCQVEAEAAWALDEEKLRSELAGKDEIGVRKYLSALSEIESAKVVFWPFWVKKIPKNKDKIKILIDTE